MSQGLHRHPRSPFYCFAYKCVSSGKWIHVNSKQRMHKAAGEVRTQFLSDLSRGIVPSEMARWTVNQAADHWLEYRKATNRPRRTLLKDAAVLKAVKARLGSKKLSDITNWMLDDYQAARAKTVTAATVNRELRYLGILLKRAKLWNRIREDYKPLPQQRSVRGQSLTAAQATILAETAVEISLNGLYLCRHK